MLHTDHPALGNSVSTTEISYHTGRCRGGSLGFSGVPVRQDLAEPGCIDLVRLVCKGVPVVIRPTWAVRNAALFILVCTVATFFTVTSGEAAADDTGWLVTEVRGARLIFRPSQNGERGAIFAVMMAGRGHERENEAHCAHIAEHMVFANQVGSVLSVREWLGSLKGALYNGWTGWDHTQFEVVVPDVHIPEALRRLVRAMFPESMDRADYEREMRNLLVPQVRHMTGQEVAGALNFAMDSLYRGTPYDSRIFDVAVESVRPETVLEWMRREYSPGRLIVVVTAKVDQKDLQEALDSVLQTVTPGPGPRIPEARLDPPEFITGRIEEAGGPLFVVGFGVDELPAEDHLPVHLLLYLAQSRILTKDVPGLEVHDALPNGSGVVTATTRSAFLVYRLKDVTDPPRGTMKLDASQTAATLERLVRDTLSELVSGDLGGELEKIPEGSAETPSLPIEIPSTLLDAFARGIQEIPGPGHISRSEDLESLLSPEGVPVLASAAEKHLPRVKVMVAYLEPGSRLSRALSWIAVVFAIIAATVTVTLYLRRRSRPKAGT